MQLKQLEVQNFRCLESCKVEFSEGFNLIFGANGNGKTSLIEAVSLLINKRSFRTRRLAQLIQNETTQCLVVGQFGEPQGKIQRVAALVDREGIRQKWGDLENPKRQDLLRQFPCVLLEPRSTNDFFYESDQRRSWLDETVFHVEHHFVARWSSFQRALQQRNAALQNQPETLSFWTSAFIESALALSEVREKHFLKLKSQFQALLHELNLSEFSTVALVFRSGWNVDEGIAEHLARSADSERRRGFTMVGPQRADIVLQTKEGLARDWLSRGQLKLATLLLKLAQVMVLAQSGTRPIVLWDDWQSELSENTQLAALELLNNSGCQVIMTSPSNSWPSEIIKPNQVFHVKHTRH